MSNISSFISRRFNLETKSDCIFFETPFSLSHFLKSSSFIYADKDFTFNQIERIYGQLNKNIKKKDGQYEFLKGWFNWSTDLVKAPVFLKLNDTAQIDVGTFSGKGPLVQTPSYQQQLAYDQMRNERKK